MIRLATKEDMPQLLRIYARARAFMAEMGNPTQWKNGYPSEEALLDEIAGAYLHVITDDETGIPWGAFVLRDYDPYYEYIEGAWLSDSPYGVLHKVASDGTHKGMFKICADFAKSRYDHLRIDTFHKNIPMQSAIKQNGFVHCGTVFLENDEPFMAFSWLK